MDIEQSESEKDKEQIKEQLYQEYLSLFKQINMSALDPDLSTGKKKLLMCRHEIVFNINAHVMEEDEQGNTVATKAICTKNYHIPVPADKDYDIYMKSFFEYLEKCLSQSAQHSTKENNNG